MENIDSRIGLIILLRERRHLFLPCSSLIYFLDESIDCVSRIENDINERESSKMALNYCAIVHYTDI
jgi:hypothetical protein